MNVRPIFERWGSVISLVLFSVVWASLQWDVLRGLVIENGSLRILSARPGHPGSLSSRSSWIHRFVPPPAGRRFAKDATKAGRLGDTRLQFHTYPSHFLYVLLILTDR